MRLTVPRKALSRIAAVVTLLATLFIAAAADANEGPTLTLEPACDGNAANVIFGVSGFPPNAVISGSLVYEVLDPAGSYTVTVIPPGASNPVGEDGSFGFLAVGPSTDHPVVWTATVSYEGNTLTESQTVDCSPPMPPGDDYAAEVVVNGKTRSTGGGRHPTRPFTVEVTNLGNGPFAVTADDIAATVRVNGSASGSVKLVSTGVRKAGERGKAREQMKFHYLWRDGRIAAGDDVEYSACVSAAGDPEASNDCGSYTATAAANP